MLNILTKTLKENREEIGSKLNPKIDKKNNNLALLRNPHFIANREDFSPHKSTVQAGKSAGNSRHGPDWLLGENPARDSRGLGLRPEERGLGWQPDLLARILRWASWRRRWAGS
ncbi:hypothetical protein TIFTF001_029305 [Ficus carica]|uniref:Uncharacterized protein n=1 Tax=Ficus carica TaxID=3494 RepID=A0AA88J2N7_FICCA|nr:hypothetical protein TIFTF001_029305 [Ficus carica]